MVKENSEWLLAYVRTKIKNADIAQDIVQEIFLNAYRAYGGYCENGRLRHWLMRIARNRLNSYFSRDLQFNLISLDTSSSDDDPLYTYLSDGETPEEEYLRRELTERILELIGKLPSKQRSIITYRFIEERSVSEIAKIMQIPEGSVKSASHYAMGKIREQLGIVKNQPGKGESIMECMEAYKYLYVYAAGAVGEEIKKPLEEHLKSCPKCLGAVKALKQLIPHITFAKEGEITHFAIDFPQLDLNYSSVSILPDNEYEDYMNRQLEKYGNDCTKWDCGAISNGCYNSAFNMLGIFDADYRELGYTTAVYDKNHTQMSITGINSVKGLRTTHGVYFGHYHPAVTRSKEAPNLYYGEMDNNFGQACKSALYMAVPAEAENIRIRRGNGVIDCESCRIVYVDRYVDEGEQIVLKFSYNINQ